MTPADRAFDLVSGFRHSQLVHAAVELKIPDLLAGGPKTSEQVSKATGIDPGRLHRLLRGLAAIGVLTEREDGTFANTDVGELFRDVPGTRRPTAMMMLNHDYWSWGHFLQTLQTGVTGQKLAHGGTLWDSIASDPDFASRFNRAMVLNSEGAAESISQSGDFEHASVVVDVGGGKGGLIGGILVRHPHLRGIVCDVSAGLGETRAYLSSLGVLERCEIAECDFFQSVPAGGDVYVLKDILHDWDDEHAAAILTVCRAAMAPGTRLMLVERSLPERVGDDPSDVNRVITDLHMMVLLGGKERAISDFKILFAATKFELTRAVPFFGQPFGIIEAAAV